MLTMFAFRGDWEGQEMLLVWILEGLSSGGGEEHPSPCPGSFPGWFPGKVESPHWHFTPTGPILCNASDWFSSGLFKLLIWLDMCIWSLKKDRRKIRQNVTVELEGQESRDGTCCLKGLSSALIWGLGIHFWCFGAAQAQFNCCGDTSLRQ